ncbi:MAG: SpoIID/LytB domain-containing protein, partial [Bacteroidota bacterium]
RVDAEGDLLVVNRIHIEDYVASVVPAEFSFPYLEGTKVQAVAARTYAVLTKNRQRSAGAPYDLADHEASQRYDGIGKENGDSRRATRETLGQIITYRGEPAEAVYHASCGGHTAANKDVWSGGRPLPYLQAKKDPYEQMSPHKSWIKRVRQQRVHAALAGHAGGAITRIAPAARSQDGRVRTLTLTRSDGQTVQIPGDVFRRLVNAGTNRLLLRSTFFDVDAEGDLYVFAGRGFGHGVGMCQWGTAEQARRGRSYQDILSFYYPGTKLTKATRGTPTAVALLDKPAYVPPSRTADDLASNTPRLDEAGPHSDTLRRANRPGSTDPVEVKRKRKRVGW